MPTGPATCPASTSAIGIDVDGVRCWRAYSLTHGPRADGRISITVKAVPGRQRQPHLVRHTRPGTLLHLEQAAGEFVLPDLGCRGKLLFVTAGSGITPVIGMLRNLFPSTDSGVLRLARSAPYDIIVLHVAPSEPDSIFLRDLRRSTPRLHPPRRAVRRRARHPRPRRPRRARARPRPSVRRSPAARAVCSTRSTAHHEERGLPLLHRAVPGLDRSSPARAARSRSTRPGPRSSATARRPILEQAEDAGVLMPSGCRMGICYSCVLPMREGVVRDLRTGALTTAVPGETARRRPDPDLHQRGRRAVPPRPLTATTSMTTIQKKPR